MSRIDYSKWDHIECSSSDDEDDQVADRGSNQPRVTRLDAPSRITRTVEGSVVVEPQQNPLTAAATCPRTEHAPTAQDPGTITTSSTPPPAWTENGGTETTPSGDLLYWSQDRTTVTLRLTLPHADIKAKQISVEVQGLLRYRDRHLAIGIDSHNQVHLKMSLEQPQTQPLGDAKILLEGTFPHAVHAPEEEDDNDERQSSLNWCLERVGSASYLVLTLCKAVPVQGVVVWWNRPLTIFAETELPQRKGADFEKSQKLQDAWDEAHRQFRSKIQQKKGQQLQQEQEEEPGT